MKTGLRRGTWALRARVALREVLPRSLGGTTVDVTARELSFIAEAGLEIALAEAIQHVTARFGEPRRASGEPSSVVVFGLGKLGGIELNTGSDVDVVLVYDTDDGAAGDVTLHEFWTHVARRTVATIEAPTEDGFVWRVDLRLRPEGSQGPLVYSWAAADRYYETWGRLWERAAFLRARPVAGNLALGDAIWRETLVPFVYRRHVDPSLATLLVELVQRSRTELRVEATRNLKLCAGGIREAEFFVQALQLIWGGREPSVRVPGTLAALQRLQGKGLVTDREARDIGDAYVLLRRTEHAIQWRTGVQTHDLPEDHAELDILSRILGFSSESSFVDALSVARGKVAERLKSLLPETPRSPQRYTVLLAELEQPTGALSAAVEEQFGDADVSEHLLRLAQRPDGLLGSVTRDRYPGFVDRLLEAVRTSSDPEQAARYLRSFFERFSSPDTYFAVLADEPQAVRRLVTVLGASAFVGEAIAARPDLADVALFGDGAVSVADAHLAVRQEIAALVDEPLQEPHERREAFIGALRRAQRRITIEVAIADLAGQLDTREATRVLSALADQILESAVEYEMGPRPRGLAVIAVGKLGGGDIGYGSDLDVIFIYDPASSPEGQHALDYFSQLAQRIIRLVTEPHTVGAGYDLDTRLRPSGSQGLLVTSLASFARYHGVPLEDASDPDRLTVSSSGAAWERQALLRARVAAGDEALGTRVLRVAHAAAYERGAAPAEEVHRMRLRMEQELGRERAGRWDLKTGRGGLLDVEFATQWLQMRHGIDVRVRTPDVLAALHSLREAGYLSRSPFEALRDGYLFLRRLEQRIRIVHGTGSMILDAGGPGLSKLARRMGFRDTEAEGDALLDEYAGITRGIRAAYLRVLGIEGAGQS